MHMKKYLRFTKTKWFIGAACLILGAAIVLGIRFATYAPEEETHYHANFAVYIDGKQEKFNSLMYYEETETGVCEAGHEESEEDNPMSRVHMHGMEYDVVHVEDELVTWGNFFTVLGWGVGDNYISNTDKIYSQSKKARLTFILNGKKVDSIANKVIGDQDKLLIDYGNQTSDKIQKEYSRIQNKALDEDNSQDPASCGGSAHHENTMHERWTHMF